MYRLAARAVLVATLAAAPAAATERPELGLPVACTLGETCHVQQYVDYDPGPGLRDFMCRSLSYDGHKGTDFALNLLQADAGGRGLRRDGAVVDRMQAITDIE
nr:hypothetical protein [uncultured Roseovarius sp.]